VSSRELVNKETIGFLFSFAEYSQLGARMKARRTLRSLGEGGWKSFGEFRKDTSELCSEELH
jgi:hypothetical protein